MTDSRTVLAVIIFLGLTALLALGGLIFLIAVEEADPLVLALVANPLSLALGALAALLASTRSTNPGEVADIARSEALADVASLTEPY